MNNRDRGRDRDRDRGKFVKNIDPNYPNYVMDVDEDTYLSYWPEKNETALVLKPKEGRNEEKRFYILKGDWREEYEEAFEQGGKEACFLIFGENEVEYKTPWSTGGNLQDLQREIIRELSENKPKDMD